MPTRRRVLAGLAGAALLVGAVVALRTTDEPPDDRPPDTSTVQPPVRITRFAADNVVLPVAGTPPSAPTELVAHPSAGRLRVAWAQALPGGVAVPGAVGYEVRWDGAGRSGTRLLVVPEAQLDGLSDGAPYRVEVRSVDAFGQRSEPATATATPGDDHSPWRTGLTGLLDEFTDQATVAAESPGSRWHVSGYRGCIGANVTAGRGLRIDLNCGADTAVLRARSPMRLAGTDAPDGVLGRVAVRTDAAGPNGMFSVDLVPGPADRVGQERGGRQDPVAVLPRGCIRVVVDDDGVRVLAASGSAGPAAPAPGPAPRRGPGVLHLFEVLVTTSGVQVRQDGVLVATGAVLPSWDQASVLLGFHGPAGVRSSAHLAEAGFTGPPGTPAGVAEVRVIAATGQVLGLADEAPGIGVSRVPLQHARSARLITTITTAGGLDPNRVVAQFGAVTVPARPATPGPPAVGGAALTVVAQVPAELLGDRGPPTLTPLVLRAAGVNELSSVLECYLEIEPGPGWEPPGWTGQRPDRTEPPRADALPRIELGLGDSAGQPLTSLVVPARGRLVLAVTLDATLSQWDTGAVAGVQGFQVWLDQRLIAAVPTATNGPGVGGRYSLSIGLGGLRAGEHVLELREFGPNGADRPASALRNFTVSAG